MIFTALQRLLPKHLLSRLVGYAAGSEFPPVRWCFINLVCLFYDINLAEAERSNRSDYRSFNDFFTRRLRSGARTVEGTVSSPADGRVAALGTISGGTLIQSKKHNYTVSGLLASDDAATFDGGAFITIYLAPHNYHRVHTACRGELHKATYIPGDLFSVNASTAAHLPDLFARNERLVCRFRTDEGPLATVLVGAMLVAGIKPVWLDRPYRPRLHVTTGMKRMFSQGEELGQFQMGSTVILLFSRRQQFLVAEGDEVRVGQAIVA